MKMSITRSLAAATLASSLALAGCVGTAPINNAQTGAMLGAVLGGVAGNQFGHGEGQTAMTILGTMLGSYLGSQWGAQLDSRDQQYLGQAVYSGRPVSWSNTSTGNQYNVTPGQVYRANYNNQQALCRPVTISGVIDGRQQNIQTKACQDNYGQWQLAH
ncbi:glycine zipper 2TM domain-containing protein [Candidatus Thiothrix sp. Deng01]|uniref:Glycine zipper 2TM domain-containing protein n=1 Tax=Candidatus Thiothrix phosphatis TaxID=3112415 RepID=A0ABU6CUH8_9GAMM|nr:glycine zipper 2TM domain-containing protein [Candidatus Thiothrix sp. Deng01]MEB4590486.1 glycine zipper 2TM domain-containing protein [Candidatus Thiothrix sp. Deng01]